jgi:uncharacterized membrane protein YkvA (DUF1232 family)
LPPDAEGNPSCLEAGFPQSAVGKKSVRSGEKTVLAAAAITGRRPAAACARLRFHPRSSNILSDMPPDPAPHLPASHWYSGPRLWRTLGKVAASAGRKTLMSALILFYCLKDRDTPAWARGVIIGALGYLILPTDLIPDILPAAGYGDDWGAIVAALGTVAAYIKDEHKVKAREQVERIFGTANPPPPAEFTQ